ncbi:MAG: hypothetical protein O7E52_01770 [Candidatus Poribacteria bacterium]|nr:hypothetical protein [Candidatus Poribacteria bacterium]
MKITRLYTGDDGESHFEDIEIPLHDAGEVGRLSEIHPVTGIIFRENDADYNYDWHPAPRRQYIIMLDSEIEIEVGDGTKKRFRGGDVFLAEDTTGRGHKTRNVTDIPRRSILVTLD